MWERYSVRAKQAIFFAQEEAYKLGHNAVCTEHILLGLTRQPECLAFKIIENLGLDPNALAKTVSEQAPRGGGPLGADMQLSFRAKRAIDHAYDQARSLGNNFIASEHLLVGLIKEHEGLAGHILADAGITVEPVRRMIAELQDIERPERPAGSAPEKVVEIRNMTQLRGRDLVSINDLSESDIKLIFSVTSLLKKTLKKRQAQSSILKDRTLAMIFEKPSLRTRVTFEVGMTQLGGHAIYLQPADIQLGARETIADAARNLERWVDVIMARVFAHSTVAELAQHAKIPVINALSDREHPCQALADFQTIKEHKGDLKGLKLAYVGDGNNVCHSLLLLAAKLGTHMSAGCPKGYEPDESVVAEAKRLAESTGSVIEVTNDPMLAVSDADAVYTDVWASMGQESEKAEREGIFPPYQVNDELLKHAKDDVIFLHCLPAHRGEEVTDEVMDGPHAVVFDEAENRLHVQKALLTLMVQE